MRIIIVPFACALLAEPVTAQEQLPILDMHLHVLAANAQGPPPPVAVCTPIQPFPAWDPATPFPRTFMGMLKAPPCTDPVWSPVTDAELVAQTIQVMERLNIFGVLSGSPNRVAEWMAAAPGRFLPGVGFQLGSREDHLSVDSLRTLHSGGHLAVLAEITNQYAGIEPADERMEPYWALAEQLDIPAGIHIGPGPPGVIYTRRSRSARADLLLSDRERALLLAVVRRPQPCPGRRATAADSGRVDRPSRPQRAGAGGGEALTAGGFEPGRASAYICQAMALYRPQRSSPTV